MRKFISLILYFAALVMVGAGLLILRNYEMDAGTRAFKEENGIAAVAKLKPLAYLGDKTAQTLIGYAYAYGWGGVLKNDADAIYWFRRCSPISDLVAGGEIDPAALHELTVGQAFKSGSEGVGVDLAESTKWLQLAAKGGSKEASAMLEKSQ